MSQAIGLDSNNISIVVDWILTEKCNLNCYYCLQHKDTRKAECVPVDYSFIKKVKVPMLFHLTGGEPFLVPNLMELINELQLTGHYVSMNTNLTRPTQQFSKCVNKEHILFVNASYHYVYRKDYIAPFVRNYMHLRDSGIFTYATIVMIPQLFDELLSVANKLLTQDVFVLPKLMRGFENGKQYPQDYDSFQLASMSSLLTKSKSKLNPVEETLFKQACTYNISIDDWQTGIPTNGTRCFDGLRFIRITETGDVVVCNGISKGNVYCEDFQFQFDDQKKNCPNKTKHYLCEKNY